MRLPLAIIVALIPLSQAEATEYYVDCGNGSDAADGLSTGAAKNTIGSLPLGANDTLRLRAGSVCDAQNNVAVNDITRGFSLSASTSGSSGSSSAANVSWNNANNGCSNVTCSEVDPVFVGGSLPSTVDGFRPNCEKSPLVGDGVEAVAAHDFGNRRFNPGNPTIGAWECASGDIAPAATRSVVQ